MTQLRKIKFFHLVIAILAILIIINVFVYLNDQSPLSSLKKRYFSLSPGNRYQAHLILWRYYLLSGNWDQANNQEHYLDSADVTSLKANYFPPQMQQTINNLQNKTNKNAEDWLELSKLQLNLGQKSAAFDSIVQAKRLDPIRNDIDQFYRQLSK